MGRPASLCALHLDDIDEDYSRGVFEFPMSPIRRGVYWTSSASPRDDKCIFAVAASDGTSLLEAGQGVWLQSKNPDHHSRALDWLSPTIVIRANDRRAVNLWDTRIRAETEEARLRHPSQVHHVRRIDENIIVVAGLDNMVRKRPSVQCTARLTIQLCTYDLRYAKPERKNQCFDSFPTYRNSLFTRSSALDVHENLVAAATGDGRVQIFDVRKGVELRSGIKNDYEHYKCVKFVDQQESGEALKLMVAAGERIEWWSFGVSTVKRLTTTQGPLTTT